MSSQEMVSVPRELADRIQQRLDYAASAFKAAKPERDELRAILAKPVQQHQGEPAWYEHAMRDEKGRPFQFQVARDKEPAFGKPDVDYDRLYSVTVEPLYEHAEPAKVEHLNEANRLLMGDCDTLRAQLAEAQAENERLKQGFYQKVTDADLKEISDYVSDPGLPTGAFLRQDAYNLANFTEHMCREVQASRHRLAEAQALLRRASAFTHDLLNPITLRRDIHAFQSASAEPSAPVEQKMWQPLTRPGQIQEGDWVSFIISGKVICATARQIIRPGTEKEEIVYNRKRNYYFITSMALDGSSSHKSVHVARAALERKP